VGVTLVHTTSTARTQSGKLKVEKSTTGIGNSLGGSLSKPSPVLSAPEPPSTSDHTLINEPQGLSPDTVHTKPKRIRVVASVTVCHISFTPSRNLSTTCHRIFFVHGANISVSVGLSCFSWRRKHLLRRNAAWSAQMPTLFIPAMTAPDHFGNTVSHVSSRHISLILYIAYRYVLCHIMCWLVLIFFRSGQRTNANAQC
jgi:hypothetical protein